MAAVCHYDRRPFSGPAVERAAAVHPISPEQAPPRFAGAVVVRGDALARLLRLLRLLRLIGLIGLLRLLRLLRLIGADELVTVRRAGDV